MAFPSTFFIPTNPALHFPKVTIPSRRNLELT
jgi:hypothetical protein